jgi:hypothetical protein
MSEKLLPTENELRKQFENGLNSKSILYDETLSQNGNYEKWKYDTGRKSVNDYSYDLNSDD